MRKKKPKRAFNARFDERVHDAIESIAESMEISKTDAVKYAVLTVVEHVGSRTATVRELEIVPIEGV